MQTPVWASRAVPSADPHVDLFPAMLDWLGFGPPAGIDGEPVWLPRSRFASKLRGPDDLFQIAQRSGPPHHPDNALTACVSWTSPCRGVKAPTLTSCVGIKS